MIVTTVTYGVLLTDEDGNPIPEFRDVYDFIYAYLQAKTKREYVDLDTDWSISCPSKKDSQLVLGILVQDAGDDLDLDELQEQWEIAMEQAPIEVQEMIKDLPESEVHILSGDY